MKRFTKTIEIKAPADKIFDFIAKPTNLPSVWPNLIAVSNVVEREGDLRDFDWQYKMAGIHFKGHSKTEEAQRGKLLRVRNEGGIPSTFRWAYEGLNGAGTRVILSVEYEIPAPIVGKVAEALLARLNERDADTLLANLKDTLEHRPTVEATANP
jgi:uncharacterized membrane protein